MERSIDKERPTDYFVFAFQITSFFAGLVTYYTFSMKGKGFLNVFNLIWTKKDNEHAETNVKIKSGIFGLKNLGRKLILVQIFNLKQETRTTV